MATYKPFAGFVQFEPNERETTSGQKLRDVVIKPIGQAGNEVESLRVTLWDDFKDVILSQGDFIAVEGKFTENTVKGKTYFNLSANTLIVLNSAPKATDEVENPVEDDEDDPGF